MKTLLVALLGLATLARADLVILQKVEGGGQSGEQTIRIKGDRMRVDVAPALSTITDGAGGIVTLMHAAKTFLKLSAAQTRLALERMQKRATTGDAPPPQLTATGRKEKVGAYECEIFTANLGSVGVTYWLAKDFPNYRALLAQMEKMQAGSLSAMGRGMMPELKDFPGMPIRTVMEMDGNKVSTELTSVKEEDVDPAIFDIPKEYKDVSPPPLDLQK